MLVVTEAARAALDPSEVAAGVDDESRIPAAESDGDDVIEGLEPGAGGQGDLGVGDLVGVAGKNGGFDS